MDYPPKRRYVVAKVPELIQSAEALQKDAFFDAISILEKEVSSRYTPDSILSTFELDNIEPSLAYPLPEALARYHEVGAIKGAQIHFEANIDTQNILVDIFVARDSHTTRIFNISPSGEDDKVYQILDNGEPLEDNMSQDDIENVLLAILLPPHTRRLLEAQRIYNGGSKLDLESKETFHLLSQVLRGRAHKSIEVRQYSLPATEHSSPSKLEIVESTDAKKMILFSGSSFIDRVDGVDEVQFSISILHHLDLDIYDDIEINSLNVLHNGAAATTDEVALQKAKIAIIEIALKFMNDFTAKLL